jgi:site-specific recombinase XerD
MLVPKIIFVFDRRKTADRQHKGSVELRITYNRKQKFISTGITVYPHQWKGGNPYVSGYETSGEDNRMLNSLWQKAHKVVSEQVETGEIDLDAIPRLLKPSENAGITFLQYVMSRIDRRSVVESTYRQQVSFYNKLHEFGGIKLFSDISEKSVRDFDEWLHAYEWKENDKYGREVVKRYSQATIGSFHKNLKAFISDAVVDGHLKENVYVRKRIKVDKGQARTDKYLTVSELESIERADMPTKSLSDARDLFVFACKTGLSYIDLMEFDPSQIRKQDDVLIYSGRRHKTGVKFTCVITRSAKAILDRFGGHLPKMPNQKYNIKLKLVADAAGIDKQISSHYARHTAAMVWLNEGIPMEVVARILGHTNLKQTADYAEILEKTIAREMKEMADD